MSLVSLKTSAQQIAGRVSILAAAAVMAGGAIASASAPAEAATTYFAKVSATGALLARSSSNITGVYKFGIGRYLIYTNITLTYCALTGTVNGAGGFDPGPGSSSILTDAYNANTAFVRTSTPSSAGSASVDDNRPFSLVITCS